MRSFLFCALLVIPSTALAQRVLTVPKTLKQRCEEFKDPASCYEVGLLYSKTSFEGDKKRGHSFLQKGCEFEMERSCSLSEAIERAEKISLEQERLDKDTHEQKLAASPFKTTEEEKACFAGDGKACREAGTYFFYISIPLDPRRAIALYEEGCRLEDEESCSSLKLIKEKKVSVFSVEP